MVLSCFVPYCPATLVHILVLGENVHRVFLYFSCAVGFLSSLAISFSMHFRVT